MPKSFPPSDALQKLLELKKVMETARVQYESAKTEYDRAFERHKEFAAIPPTGNVRRIVNAYSSCQERYQQAAMEFHQYLLDRTFPEEKASGAIG